jgi:hypothetical protein
MSLGLKAYHANGGTFAPRVEYNAKSGRFVVVNRTEGADGAFATDKIDVTMSRPEFALDCGSIEIGWISFPPGAGPDATLVPYGQAMPARPSSKHKAGFQVQVWNGREPEAREFKSTAGVVVDAIEELWDQIAAAPEAARGDIPVIQFVDSTPIAARRGTNYMPVFRLLRWITRDDRVFGPRTVAPPNSNAAPQPAAPSLPAGPPAPAQWQAPAAAPAPQPTRAW